MGFFGGDNDNDSPGQSHAEQLADQQLQMNKAELENKKQNLYDTRLDIIKGQGGESWVPDRNKRARPPGGSGGGNSSRFPFKKFFGQGGF